MNVRFVSSFSLTSPVGIRPRREETLYPAHPTERVFGLASVERVRSDEVGSTQQTELARRHDKVDVLLGHADRTTAMKYFSIRAFCISIAD